MIFGKNSGLTCFFFLLVNISSHAGEIKECDELKSYFKPKIAIAKKETKSAAELILEKTKPDDKLIFIGESHSFSKSRANYGKLVTEINSKAPEWNCVILELSKNSQNSIDRYLKGSAFFAEVLGSIVPNIQRKPTLLDVYLAEFKPLFAAAKEKKLKIIAVDDTVENLTKKNLSPNAKALTSDRNKFMSAGIESAFEAQQCKRGFFFSGSLHLLAKKADGSLSSIPDLLSIKKLTGPKIHVFDEDAAWSTPFTEKDGCVLSEDLPEKDYVLKNESTDEQGPLFLRSKLEDMREEDPFSKDILPLRYSDLDLMVITK